MSVTTVQAAAATSQIFDHHLGAFAQGLDELLKDYDDGSVIVTPEKTYRGTTEIRGFFKAFLDDAQPAFWDAFKVTSKSTEGEIAYLAWEARPFIELATDTLYVRNGKIAVQTFTAFSG